ncbi:hypothetical protein BH11PSE11_BH11PSE11_19850 [soil metagenome]
MNDSQSAAESIAFDAETASPQRASFVKTGLTLVLLGAVALLLHAYLPIWTFGNPSTFTLRWPLTVFLSHVLLGLVALASVALFEHWASRRPAIPLWKRMLLGSALIFKATGLATYLVIPLLARLLVDRNPILLNLWLLSIFVAIAFYACYLLVQESGTQRRRSSRVQLEADALRTALDRTELAMLEAQIEPHFLFNTLAHVKRQYRIDADAADNTLAALIDYLDRALPALQRADWTLGDELGLVRVYLEILAQRFGERLHFTIEATDAERAIRLPALTVATLVENAVRHGLAPKTGGGSVAILAERDARGVSISVCDDGVGLRVASGTGLGLATVRARLRGAFGDQGTLLVEPLPQGGVRAAIRIPDSPMNSSSASSPESRRT